MKTSSSKSKGRKLQQLVRDLVLRYFPDLTVRDVESTSMGANGADLKLSTKAFTLFPYSIECKNLASIAVYKHFEQAQEHAKKDQGIPMLVIKQNRSEPLVVLSLEQFFKYYYG